MYYKIMSYNDFFTTCKEYAYELYCSDLCDPTDFDIIHMMPDGFFDEADTDDDIDFEADCCFTPDNFCETIRDYIRSIDSEV